jgi:methyl-accepting chemotaxis protein
MTEKIQQIIDDIRQKMAVLDHQLTEVRASNAVLQAELNESNIQLEKSKNEGEILVEAVNELKIALEAANNQVVEVDRPTQGRRDDEIDELVKEIEYCISQLKK